MRGTSANAQEQIGSHLTDRVRILNGVFMSASELEREKVTAGGGRLSSRPNNGICSVPQSHYFRHHPPIKLVIDRVCGLFRHVYARGVGMCRATLRTLRTFIPLACPHARGVTPLPSPLPSPIAPCRRRWWIGIGWFFRPSGSGVRSDTL